MTYKQNITAILECYFAGFKEEIIDSACNRILEQEPKTHWIPISERLPDFSLNNIVSEDVLVFDGVDIRVGEYRKRQYLHGAAGYWRVYGCDEYVEVIAWMPLPEPYEPQEREGKV